MSAYVGIHPGPGRMVTIIDHKIFEDQTGKHDIMLLKIDPPENKIKPVVFPKCRKKWVLSNLLSVKFEFWNMLT